MRILHSADWHLGELTGPVIDGQNARLMDTVRCLDFLVETAEQEQSDVILIAGDPLNKSQMWASPMLNLIDILSSRLRRLAAVAPTVLMFGTATHDSIDAFHNITSMQIENLIVITTPFLFNADTNSGPLQIACIPGFDKGYFRAKNPGMDPTEENAMCTKLLGDIVLGLGTQIDPQYPSVLMAHYTVAGSEYDNGQISIFNNSEVTLPREALAASPFDIVCLGHIHKAQEVPSCGQPTFYSGALNGLTFNEEGQTKGFYIHDIEMVGGVPRGESDGEFGFHFETTSRFIETPAREFLTLTMDEYDIQVFINQGASGWWEEDLDGATYYPSPSGKIVRIHYSCSDELNKQLNRKALEKALYDAGAFYVAEIKPEQITTALSKQEMTENTGPLENLAQWLEGEGHGVRDINALVELARPLVELVSAKMPTGKLAGVFVPKRIEVRNYRSYREESFDFNPIVFATVNGSNGVGKSALFMDALCDCLFEEPREGELTGWINNDVSVKSGAITFEFAMGDTDWKVVRTRVKSGKTTLALQELVDGQWVDRSVDKKDDTQAKITALLGMDAMTFRCCGLIMQDAYGLFLEADKADRMEVLGNILGLGIYEQLTELAKAKVTETNRSLTAAKERLAGLDEKLKAVPETQFALDETNREIKETEDVIVAKEKELAETEELIRTLQTKTERTAELQRQIDNNAREINGLKTEKAEQQSRIDTAQKKLDAEEQIIQKAAEHEQVKQQVAVLQARAPRLEELNTEKNRIIQEMAQTGVATVRLEPQIREIEDLLRGRAELEKAAADYGKATADLLTQDDLFDKWTSLDSQARSAEAKLNNWDNNHESALKNLRIGIEAKQAQTETMGLVTCKDTPMADICPLLEGARKALQEIADSENGIKKLSLFSNPYVDEWMNHITARNDLEYNRAEHKKLKDRINELRPKSVQATGLKTKDQLLKTLQTQKKQQEEQRANLARQLNRVKAGAQALATELEPLAGLEQRLPKLELWVKAKEELPACREIVRAARERIEAIDRDITGKEDLAVKLDKERNLLLIDTANIDSTRANAENLRGYVKDLQEKQNSLHIKVGSLEAKMDTFKKDQEERDRIAADMEPTSKLLVRYQILAKAFSLDGIPFSIVKAVVPELSAMANEILADMTGGQMSLEMKTDRIQKSSKKEVNALEIWINDYQRGSLPYLSRSGGQKVKAALSVAFALADLKARRAGIQLGMMFCDEPPFLDGDGTEAYCDALMTMSQRFSNMKVIAISHDPRMKARFPQVLEVVDAGEEGSKVRLVA